MFPLQPRIRALTLDVEVILRGRGGWIWGRVCMGSQGSLAQDSDEPILPLFPYLLHDELTGTPFSWSPGDVLKSKVHSGEFLLS